MKSNKELKFFITTTEKIVSVNSMYQAGIKYIGGKPRPYIYKSKKAEKFSNEVLDQLRAVDFSDYVDWLRNTKLFSLTISFIVKSNITRRDVQNMQKLIIDLITKYIREDLGVEKFDDSLFTSVHFYKSIIPKAAKEYCCIQMIESNDKLIVDLNDKPQRFFLGGTTAGTGWRDEIIPELKSRGLNYFDPRVPDWTEEARKKEEEEKEKCDTMLFLITPEMKGVFSVAEVINSSWEVVSSGNGFVYFGILDNGEWDEPRWRSLQATLEMVKEISQGNSRIKYGVIKKPIEILDL